MSATFCELENAGLIAFTGPDTVAFLQAQLTSDVAGAAPPKTQYSGYCTPKGRLLATFLMWRTEDEVLLQLPAELRDSIQARISKYVLRSKVKVSDARARYTLLGLAGSGADAAADALAGAAPNAPHDVVVRGDIAVTRLPVDRYLVIAPAESRDAVRGIVAAHAVERPETLWSALDIEAGTPVISAATQELYVPQMVNLDLIGAVSYSKGCYPGQEIVARTHYLGRVKQRTYRIGVPRDVASRVGDRLYSSEFGPDQASGTVINVSEETSQALAVLYTSAVARGLHYGNIEGPRVELLQLPYALDA